MKRNYFFYALVLLLAACAVMVGASALRPLGQPVQVVEVPKFVCVEMDSFENLEQLTDRAQVILVGEYTQQLEPKEDQYGQTHCHAFAVRQVLKGHAPQQIIVCRSYSSASTYQAPGEQIAYQLPMPTYTEPLLGQTTLLFLSCRHTQDGDYYVSVGEPWEVIRDEEGLAQTHSNWINPPPDLPEQVETYVMNQNQDILYHIFYPREQTDRQDFITGQPWDSLLEQIQTMAE